MNPYRIKNRAGDWRIVAIHPSIVSDRYAPCIAAYRALRMDGRPKWTLRRNEHVIFGADTLRECVAEVARLQRAAWDRAVTERDEQWFDDIYNMWSHSRLMDRLLHTGYTGAENQAEISALNDLYSNGFVEKWYSGYRLTGRAKMVAVKLGWVA